MAHFAQEYGGRDEKTAAEFINGGGLGVPGDFGVS